MRLKRRDVFVAAAAAGAGALMSTTRSVRAATEREVSNLQILMKGLFVLDLTAGKEVECYFVAHEKHVVTLTCDLADLDPDKYPGNHTVIVDPAGRELGVWTLKKSTLRITPAVGSGVTYRNSEVPTTDLEDLYWIASVPALTKVKCEDFQKDHASIGPKLVLTDGSLKALSPSKTIGKCPWTFYAADASAVLTRGVTDQVLYTSAEEAKKLTLTDGTSTWTFSRANVRLTLSSMPEAAKGSNTLTHFPQLAKLFKNVDVPEPKLGDCAVSMLELQSTRESGTAYCPPGKRP